MATQQEVINFIKSNYRFEELSGGMMKFVFELGGGRSQLVFASVSDVIIQYSSPFASVNDVTPKQALEANQHFTFGMQMIGESYVVQHVAFLNDLDASEIKDGFQIVAGIADELEQKLVGGDKL